ncbi:MAG: ABC transporter substrate-binding protein, partial [Actinomycetota bacterium]
MTSRSARATLARVLAALLAFTLIAAACGGDDDGDGDATTVDDSTEDTTDDTDDGSAEAAGDGEAVAPTIAEPVEDDTTDEGPVRGGVLRVATEAESDGLNPVANNFAVSAYLMGLPIFDPLFAFDQDGNWFPNVAESATKIEGTTSWQVKVREGVTYHNGEEMDADDMIATFQAQLADPIISLAVAPSFQPENPIEKIDEYTVQYNLLRDSAHFPANLTSQLGLIPPASYIEAAADDETLNQMPIGQGAFRMVSRVQDDRTVVEAFPDYWGGADRVYLDGIEFFPITDTALAAERVAAGDIDVVVTTNPDAILTLRDADGVDTIENLFSSENDIMMNTRSAPFDDIRVRQALTFAADREGFSQLIGQGTSPLANSIFHPELIWNNPDVVQEGNTPELAGPLVEAYCADVPENCTDGK